MHCNGRLKCCNKIKQNIYFIATFILFYCTCNRALMIKKCCFVQVFRSNSTDQILQAQKFKPRLPHVSSHMDHISRNIVPNRSRNELHRPPSADAYHLYFLQLRFSDLLVYGVFLHSVHRHVASVLENFPRHSQEGAQVRRLVRPLPAATAPFGKALTAVGWSLRSSDLASTA